MLFCIIFSLTLTTFFLSCACFAYHFFNVIFYLLLQPQPFPLNILIPAPPFLLIMGILVNKSINNIDLLVFLTFAYLMSTYRFFSFIRTTVKIVFDTLHRPGEATCKSVFFYNISGTFTIFPCLLSSVVIAADTMSWIE